MATETIGMLSADSTSSNGIKLCELLYNGYWEFDNEVMVHFMSSLVILLKCFRV